MKTTATTKKAFLALLSLLVLTACSGGGGGTASGGGGTAAFTLGGSVSGLAGTVVLQNNGGDNRSVSADGSFSFAAAVADGASYGVAVFTQPAGQTCSVANGAGTVSGANVTNVTVICAAGAFTVGGTVSGLSGTVVLRNNGGNDLTLSADGAFTFSAPLADGSGYAVSVFTQPAGQGCSVANGTGAIAGANVTNVAISCAAGALTIGGTVSGLSGTVVLQNNGGDNLTRSVNGSFTFATALANGSAYNVTVLTQPSGQSCTVTNGAGTLSGSHVTNVSVACANTAGYVVAARVTPAEINIYRADQPNVPIETIASATFIGPLTEDLGTRLGIVFGDPLTYGLGKRLGVVYGKLAAPGVFFELGVFLRSQRVILAAETGGHTYKYLGLIDGATRRAVFLDTVGANVGVGTATLDGVESHLVKSGCLSVTLPVFSAAGVAFLCEETAGVKKVYYSNGVAPAVYMGSDLREPKALTATHLITADITNAFLIQLRTQPLAGALGGSVQLDQNLITPSTLFGGMDGGAETIMAINPQGIVLGRSFSANVAHTPQYEAWTVNADLSVGGNTFMRSRSVGPPLLVELSPDGSKASVVYRYMAGVTTPDKGAVITLGLPPSPGNPLFLTVVPATDAAMDVRFLSGGKISAGWGPQSGTPTSLNVYNADGTVFSGISALPGSSFVATKDNYLLYVSGDSPNVIPPCPLKSSLFDGTADLTLSLAARLPRPTLRSDGTVTFVDDAGFPWIASADPSIPAPLRLMQKIDDVPTIFVENVGDGSGNRVFLTLHRMSGDADVVMFNLNDRTTTPIVSGATNDTGYFFPN